VKNLLAEAKRQHVDGIVLDLSRHGGGLLGEAVRLGGLFLDEGRIAGAYLTCLAVTTRLTRRDVKPYYSISCICRDNPANKGVPAAAARKQK
jgi:hypothetical protein